MTTDNLVDIIELLLECKNTEQDPGLEEGQVLGSNGEIVTL